MKSLLLGMVLFSANAVFAQADFDHKAERKAVSAQLESDQDLLTSLYKNLYDDQGNEKPEVRAQVDSVTAKLQVNFAKVQYLWSVGFEKVQDHLKTSDALRHYKRASNRFAAVTVKDSKGQIISHESAGDMINDLYDKDIEKKYGCYEDDEAETSLPYDESEAAKADIIMQTLGYSNYTELMTANQKAFCEIEKTDRDDKTEIVQCNDFISGVRLSLLDSLENKVIKQSKKIKSVGYFNASDEMFLDYELTSGIKNAVEEQVKNIEAACLDRKFELFDEVFNYLEEEVEKDGITIEYTTINTNSSKGRLE